MQAWALNRYYYQSRIPIKDALLLAKSEDPAFRRAWRKRIVDHDGNLDGYGGIERWLRLAEAAGLSPEEVFSCIGVLPGVRLLWMPTWRWCGTVLCWWLLRLR